MNHPRAYVVLAIGICLGATATLIGQWTRAQAAPPPTPAQIQDGHVLLNTAHTVCYPAIDVQSSGWSFVPYTRRGQISLHISEGKANWFEAAVIECYSKDPQQPMVLGEKVAELRAELWQWRRRR